MDCCDRTAKEKLEAQGNEDDLQLDGILSLFLFVRIGMCNRQRCSRNEFMSYSEL